MRNIYHVPTMLTTCDYEPLNISCDDCLSYYDRPPITLFGSPTCKEFVETHEAIFENAGKLEALKLFNQHRSEDILLRRFLESDSVAFADDAKNILIRILKNDRSIFNITTYGGITHEHLPTYDHALFLKVAFETLNEASNVDSKNDTLSGLIARTLFNFISSFSTPEIYLQFALQSDVGNLNIQIKHVLIEDLDCKSRMIKLGWTEEQIYAQFGTRYKIDATKPIRVEIYLAE